MTKILLWLLNKNCKNVDHWRNEFIEKKLNRSFKEMLRLKHLCSGLVIILLIHSRHTTHTALDSALYHCSLNTLPCRYLALQNLANEKELLKETAYLIKIKVVNPFHSHSNWVGKQFLSFIFPFVGASYATVYMCVCLCSDYL